MAVSAVVHNVVMSLLKLVQPYHKELSDIRQGFLTESLDHIDDDNGVLFQGHLFMRCLRKEDEIISLEVQ